MVKRLLKLIILLMLVLPTVVFGAQLEAVLESTRINLEESFTLELRAVGSVDGEPDLSVLNEDFELLGRSEASQMRIVNGSFDRSTTWILRLLARSAGTKLIPPLCVETDCSEPIAVDVRSAKSQSSATGGTVDLVLEASVDTNRLPVQSQLIYTVRLLTRLSFVQASLSDPQPTGVEAVVLKLGEDRQQEVRRDGVRYQLIERVYAVFPQQTGQLTFPPLRLDAQVNTGGGNSYDPFNRRVRQIRKRTDEVKVEVLPAVKGAGRHWLPATELRLHDEWLQNPPQLTVGEPVTRTLTLQATGAPAAQLPDFVLDIPAGVKSYPDQPAREDKLGATGITGVLQQKLALVPTRAGQLLLPKINIDWWDTKNERWRQLNLPEIKLEVLPANVQPAISTPLPVQPIEAKISEAAPVVVPASVEVVRPGAWPWVSLVLGLGWLGTLLFILLRRGKRKPQSDIKDIRPGLKAARRQLAQIAKAGETNQLRDALLTWGQVLFVEDPPQTLEQLLSQCGEPLSSQVNELNRCLYSQSGGQWEGDALLAAVDLIEQERGKKKKAELPSFYPEKN